MSLFSDKYKLAKLHDAGCDLTKTWYVYFSFRDNKTGKFRFFRLYGDINQSKKKEQRVIKAQRLIDDIDLKLKSGWNPFSGINYYTDFLSTKRKGIEKQADYSVLYWLNHYLSVRDTRNRNKTTQTYLSKLRIFFEFLKQNSIDKINIQQFTEQHAKDFNTYLIKKNLSPTTVNEYNRTLKSFFTDLVADELILKNPFGKFKKIPEHREGKHPFSNLQIAQLKNEICKTDAQLWLAVNLMYYCFIRPGEIRMLKLSDIYFEEQKIKIRSEISKNKKTQYVSIPFQLLDLMIKQELNKYNSEFYVIGCDGEPGQEPVTRDFLSKKHKEITKRLGYSSRFTFYSWKHTGALAAWRAGISIKDIKEQMRHHSLDMTDIYLKTIGAIDCEDIRNKFPML
jgi:integrase